MTRAVPKARRASSNGAATLEAPETEGPRSKRALILTAAIEKFGKDGYEHTKWATIADQVGIGQTALYHYFESKAHCLLTIMSLELARSLQAVRTRPPTSTGPTRRSRRRSPRRTP